MTNHCKAMGLNCYLLKYKSDWFSAGIAVRQFNKNGYFWGRGSVVNFLVDTNSRHNSRLNRLLRQANLRIQEACLEDLDYDPRRKLGRAYVARLADCSWINEYRNLIITGATGTGKTYLACAFGNSAVSVKI